MAPCTPVRTAIWPRARRVTTRLGRRRARVRARCVTRRSRRRLHRRVGEARSCAAQTLQNAPGSTIGSWAVRRQGGWHSRTFQRRSATEDAVAHAGGGWREAPPKREPPSPLPPQRTPGATRDIPGERARCTRETTRCDLPKRRQGVTGAHHRGGGGTRARRALLVIAAVPSMRGTAQWTPGRRARRPSAHAQEATHRTSTPVLKVPTCSDTTKTSGNTQDEDHPGRTAMPSCDMPAVPHRLSQGGVVSVAPPPVTSTGGRTRGVTVPRSTAARRTMPHPSQRCARRPLAPLRCDTASPAGGEDTHRPGPVPPVVHCLLHRQWMRRTPAHDLPRRTTATGDGTRHGDRGDRPRACAGTGHGGTDTTPPPRVKHTRNILRVFTGFLAVCR